MGLIIKLLVSTLSVIVGSYLLPGVKVPDFSTALIVAIVLGVINMFMKPILILLTLPLNILTLGLFTLIINGLLILLTSRLVPGFYVENIWWAILFSIIISLVSTFLNHLMDS